MKNGGVECASVNTMIYTLTPTMAFILIGKDCFFLKDVMITNEIIEMSVRIAKNQMGVKL